MKWENVLKDNSQWEDGFWFRVFLQKGYTPFELYTLEVLGA